MNDDVNDDITTGADVSPEQPSRPTFMVEVSQTTDGMVEAR